MITGINFEGLEQRIYVVESAETSFTIDGLNGNVHGMYEIRWAFQFDSTSWTVEMKPNNSTANMLSGVAANNSSPSQSTTSWPLTVSGGGSSTPGWSCGAITMMAAQSVKGQDSRLMYTGRSTNATNSTASQSYGQREVGGILRATGANLTSIVFESNEAFQPGSFVIVKQLTPSGIFLA